MILPLVKIWHKKEHTKKILFDPWKKVFETKQKKRKKKKKKSGGGERWRLEINRIAANYREEFVAQFYMLKTFCIDYELLHMLENIGI